MSIAGYCGGGRVVYIVHEETYHDHDGGKPNTAGELFIRPLTHLYKKILEIIIPFGVYGGRGQGVL